MIDNAVTMEMIPCPKCGKPFPKLRKEKYGYNFCVNCSTVERVVGITTVEGDGDHTWNDLIIMPGSKAAAIAKRAAEATGHRVSSEAYDNQDDSDVNGRSLLDKAKSILENSQDNLSGLLVDFEDCYVSGDDEEEEF